MPRLCGSPPSLDVEVVKSAARGRWLDILIALAAVLEVACAKVGRHVPCPRHGGRDGFRLFKDAAETGGGVCNSCGTFADGFALLQWANGWSFPQAIEAVASHLGMNGSVPEPSIGALLPVPASPVPTRGTPSREKRTWPLERLEEIWKKGESSAPRVSEYLKHRGLSGEVPEALRFDPAHPYFEDRKLIGKFPAILAQVLDVRGELVALLRVYLATDGPGKAKVAEPKKLTLPT
ncbi:MAG: hypothetical protein HY608_01710, partial [Planctomycetes bacterium]|nr:hypothetical protein [Planctomycetota bacterium]